MKLINASIIQEQKYPIWLASIIQVKEKMTKFTYECPKDDFPLPMPKLFVDNASSHAIFSLMDGSSRYNQIKMALQDKRNIIVRTLVGIYYYKVMPFSLMNVGYTY